MIYDIRHVTTYRYGSPVTFAQCTLALSPPSGGGQVVDEASILVEPRPRLLTAHRSFFGHTVHLVEIDVPHRALRVESRARVTVERAPAPTVTTSWTETRDEIATSLALDAEAPGHFSFPSPMIRFDDAVTRYAAACFGPDMSAVEGGRALMTRIRNEFRYDPDATRVSTPLLEAFTKRHGVCQDFAHVMVAGLRGLGLAARYVSGYIRTIPPPGQARLEGADATHAWVDLWCGPEAGWVGFDPTNAILAGDDHIVLATGRDYADVAPVGGVLLGADRQDITVEVDVVPRGEVSERARGSGPAPSSAQ